MEPLSEIISTSSSFEDNVKIKLNDSDVAVMPGLEIQVDKGKAFIGRSINDDYGGDNMEGSSKSECRNTLPKHPSDKLSITYSSVCSEVVKERSLPYRPYIANQHENYLKFSSPPPEYDESSETLTNKSSAGSESSDENTLMSASLVKMSSMTSQPAEHLEHVEPMLSAEHVEPMGPVDPMGSNVDPVEFVESMRPMEFVESMRPVESATLVDPVEYVDPVGLEQAAYPSRRPRSRIRRRPGLRALSHSLMRRMLPPR